jgi:hypothetical protein
MAIGSVLGSILSIGRVAVELVLVGRDLVQAARGTKTADDDKPNPEKNLEQAAGAAKSSESRNAGKRQKLRAL